MFKYFCRSLYSIRLRFRLKFVSSYPSVSYLAEFCVSVQQWISDLSENPSGLRHVTISCSSGFPVFVLQGTGSGPIWRRWPTTVNTAQKKYGDRPLRNSKFYVISVLSPFFVMFYSWPFSNRTWSHCLNFRGCLPFTNLGKNKMPCRYVHQQNDPHVTFWPHGISTQQTVCCNVLLLRHFDPVMFYYCDSSTL
jgi:hypothetical protein